VYHLNQWRYSCHQNHLLKGEIVDSNSSQESVIAEILARHIDRAKIMLQEGNVKLGQVKMWCGAVRSQLVKVYGKESDIRIITAQEYPR
jgi:hypothetical protein